MRKVLEQFASGALPHAGSNGEVRSVSASECLNPQISQQEARRAAIPN